MTIRPFLENEIGVFDEALTRAMGVAFEHACATLRLVDKSDPLTELVACKIIDAAKAGERDPDKLYDEVLRWTATASRLRRRAPLDLPGLRDMTSSIGPQWPRTLAASLLEFSKRGLGRW